MGSKSGATKESESKEIDPDIEKKVDNLIKMLSISIQKKVLPDQDQRLVRSNTIELKEQQ